MSSFWLEFEKDGHRQEFSFDGGQVSIGRGRGADLVLDHPTVSRQHALIVADQRGHRLVVLSRGGLTAVDGEAVSGDVQLYDGSAINFGQLQCTYRSHDAPPRPQQHSSPSSGGWEPASAGWNDTGGSGANWNQPSGSAPNWNNPSGSNASWNNPDTSGANWNPDASGASWNNETVGAGSAPELNGGWESERPKTDGLVTWDEIAEQADADSEAAVEAGKTDFERMQEAQAKLEKQSQGTSPAYYIALIIVVGFMGWLFMRDTGTGALDDDGPAESQVPTGQIALKVDCVGAANCKSQALSAYKVGSASYERMGADITNLYEAHLQFVRADKLLAKGNVTTPPPEMEDMPTKQAAVADQLQALFQQHRVRFRNAAKLKDKTRMAKALTALKAYVPDERCDYHQWAASRELKMKEAGMYPAVTPTY